MEKKEAEIIKSKEENRLFFLREKEGIEGGYSGRFDSIYPIKKELSKYIKGDPDEPNGIEPRITELSNGELVDHHAMGYFAPMQFERVGFGGVKRTPAEQMKVLDELLSEHGIRLIYVPLPCKIAVNPRDYLNKTIVPEDGIIIPQWRSLIEELVSDGMEVVDCYYELKNTSSSFSKNHHISPLGGQVIAQRVSDYIQQTTRMEHEHNGEISKKKEYIGSPILSVSGNSNSPELGMEMYEVEKYYYNDRPIDGYQQSEIAVIGDCNLQIYRGTGCDVNALLSGSLNYPTRYLGRYLPFANKDSIDRLPPGSLSGVSILVYIGFVSACFVRAYRDDICWCTNMISEEAFERL